MIVSPIIPSPATAAAATFGDFSPQLSEKVCSAIGTPATKQFYGMRQKF